MNDKIVLPSDRLNADFWNQRYLNQTTAWDLGHPSPPLQSFIDTLSDKKLNILIPGAGNAYEASYCMERGFTEVTVLDIAPALVESLKIKFRSSPIQIVLGDFFDHTGQYDLILEQTFFCALHPDHRVAYATKMAALLKPGGQVAGLLFNRLFEAEGPPFGGTAYEYESLFKEHFESVSLAPCIDSHPARAGTELFIRLKKSL